VFVLVITGGLGAGKSTAASYYRDRGATVVDVDEVARDLMTPGSPVLSQVAQAFGPEVIRPDGSLDRAALAQVAFVTAQTVTALDSIVHPAVSDAVTTLVDELATSADPPDVLVLEVPLLTEDPGLAALADEVLSIEAPVAERVARAGRRGIDDEDAQRRIAVQASDADRALLAGEVIVNAGDERAFEARLADYWDRRVAPALAR